MELLSMQETLRKSTEFMKLGTIYEIKPFNLFIEKIEKIMVGLCEVT